MMVSCLYATILFRSGSEDCSSILISSLAPCDSDEALVVPSVSHRVELSVTRDVTVSDC